MRELTLLFLLAVCTCIGRAQDNSFGIDNKVYAYYEKCEALIESKEVLPMIDTLFQMAVEVGDERMQAVALAKYVDHYYFLSEKDSLKASIVRVQAFARETHQPKYYYFVWNRYITYFVKKRQYNLAFLEIDAMQKEAYAEKYMDAVADGYRSMADIYSTKECWELAATYYKKSIKLVEEYKLEDFNLSLSYSSLGDCLLYLNRLEEAKSLFDKALQLTKRPSQVTRCNTRLLSYYIAKGDVRKAADLLEEIEKAIPTTLLKRFHMSKIDYSILIGHYEEAESLCNEIDPDCSDRNILLDRVKCYKSMGKYSQATDCLERYIHLVDSLNSIDANIAFGEFATMLDVNKLNQEKNSLELTVKEEKLQKIRYVTFCLIAILLVGAILYIRVFRLNKKLKQSEKNLLDKNKALLEAEIKILQEKEKAEKASSMKSAFIQNISHEIRTPLNSILGFSQVLTELLNDNEQVKEFTDMIVTQSDNLLKLVGDVIEISKLDSITEEIPTDKVDINAMCHMAIERVSNQINEQVHVELVPGESKAFINSNEQMILIVLTNLLHNAAKFTEEGNIKIEYKWSEDREWMQIQVTDTGIGIPEEKQEMVFERFVKLDEFKQGFGLGLSISRLSAQLLGGSLVFDKTYQKGCRIIFTLPATIK